MNRRIQTQQARAAELIMAACILLLGFGLRTAEIGAAPLQGDEAWTTFLAFDFGYNGRHADVGVMSSAGINQPPLFHEIFALPLAFSADPRIARLFMAALHLVAMARAALVEQSLRAGILVRPFPQGLATDLAY